MPAALLKISNFGPSHGQSLSKVTIFNAQMDAHSSFGRKFPDAPPARIGQSALFSGGRIVSHKLIAKTTTRHREGISHRYFFQNGATRIVQFSAMNTVNSSDESLPAPSTSGTSCKRKISYAEVDDSLLALILAEPETVVGQETITPPNEKSKIPSKRKKTTKSTSQKKVKRPVAANKGDSKQHDGKRKSRSTKNTWLCKKSFLSITNDLKRVSLVDVVSHVLKFLDNEKHIKTMQNVKSCSIYYAQPIPSIA